MLVISGWANALPVDNGICGWVYNGLTPPPECPLCHVDQENFILINE